MRSRVKMLLGVSTTIARDATTVRGLDASPVAAMAKVVVVGFAVDDQEALSSVVVVVVCGIFSPLVQLSGCLSVGLLSRLSG